jgi:hypothetical protein
MTSRRGGASRIALDRKFDNIRLMIFSTKVELMSADELAVCRAIRALSLLMGERAAATGVAMASDLQFLRQAGR